MMMDDAQRATSGSHCLTNVVPIARNLVPFYNEIRGPAGARRHFTRSTVVFDPQLLYCPPKFDATEEPIQSGVATSERRSCILIVRNLRHRCKILFDAVRRRDGSQRGRGVSKKRSIFEYTLSEAGSFGEHRSRGRLARWHSRMVRFVRPR